MLTYYKSTQLISKKVYTPLDKGIKIVVSLRHQTNNYGAPDTKINLKGMSKKTMNATEKTFEELVKESAEIADARKKVFGELQSQITTRFLPALSNVMKNFNIDRIYFETSSPVFAKQQNSPNLEFPGTYIYITSFSKDEISGGYEELNRDTNEIEYCIDDDKIKLQDFKCLKTSAISFAKKIKSKIKDINRRYANLNDQADLLLEK